MGAARTTGRKVLVIRFGALGDLVLATSVLEALAAESPPAEVHLLTKARYAPLFDGDPRVSRLIAHSAGIGGALRSLRAVRRERYDAVLDLHATPRSRVIARAARGAERSTLDKRSRERRALVAHAREARAVVAAQESPSTLRAPSPRLAGGMVAWYAEMLGRPLPEPRLIVPANRLAGARALLARAGLRDGFIAVAPFAGRRTKEWPRERLLELVRLARGSGGGLADRRGAARSEIPLLLIGADADAARIASLASEAGIPFVLPPLELLPALLALASCVFTTDSAPLHVAEAAGTPAIALFGPTVRAFGFAPRHPRSIVLEIDLACRPCSLHGDDACPLGHHRCLAEIDAARALAALRTLFASLASERLAPASRGTA